MYSHVACDVMKERTLYLLKPSSLIWHLMPYLFLFTLTVLLLVVLLFVDLFNVASIFCLSMFCRTPVCIHELGPGPRHEIYF